MSILVACPKCQTKLKVEESVLGRNIKRPAAAVFAVKCPGRQCGGPRGTAGQDRPDRAAAEEGATARR